jgi:hypothetical protein
MITSFIIHDPRCQAVFGRLPQAATIRSLVCSCEMRPVAFLEPGAFIVTDLADPAFIDARRINITSHRLSC